MAANQYPNFVPVSNGQKVRRSDMNHEIYELENRANSHGRDDGNHNVHND